MTEQGKLRTVGMPKHWGSELLFFSGPYDIMVLLGDRIASRAQRRGGKQCKGD